MEENAPMTMKDIAREFGISVATVSRALKNSPRISEERRKAIQQYAREHNFYPNAIGEALRHSRVMPQRLIGVIVPEFTHYYFSSILTGIEETARARGYQIMVALSGEQYERETQICENFHRYKVCGVIVSQAKDTKNYDHYQKLIDAGIPMVFYDRICTGVNASRVVVDDYLGAMNAVTHLIESGCKRIAFSHEREPAASLGVLVKQQIIKDCLRLRFLKFTADENFTDLHDPVVQTCIKDGKLFLEIIQASHHTVPVAGCFRCIPCYLSERFCTCLKGSSRFFHGFSARCIVDHDPVSHLMIETGIDDVDLLSAHRTDCSEELPCADPFLQVGIQFRIDAAPYRKIMLMAAFGAADFFYLFT